MRTWPPTSRCCLETRLSTRVAASPTRVVTIVLMVLLLGSSRIYFNIRAGLPRARECPGDLACSPKAAIRRSSSAQRNAVGVQFPVRVWTSGLHRDISRYHFSPDQILVFAVYFAVGVLGVPSASDTVLPLTAVFALGEGRAASAVGRQQSQRPQALARAWAQSAVILGYRIHGERGYGPTKSASCKASCSAKPCRTRPPAAEHHHPGPRTARRTA